MNDIIALISPLLPLVPFVLLVLLGGKNNLKPEDRSRQCYMPIVAVVFCIVSGIFLGTVANWIVAFFNNLDDWLRSLADWVNGLFDGKLAVVGSVIAKLADTLEGWIKKLEISYWASLLVNSVVAVLYLIFKRIVITVLKGICRDGVGHYETVSQLVYRKQPDDGQRYLKPYFAQGATLMKSLFYITVVLGIAATSVSSLLQDMGLIASLYYPVFSVILVGEIYYYLDGPRWSKQESSLAGEDDRATQIRDYTFMRRVLGRNFGDKLMSDNTSVNSDLLRFKTNNEMIEELTADGRIAVEAYGLFMKKKVAEGLELDQNYLASGLALLNGKSMIFNNPFYYDLIPYIFFPINRAILRRKKVLIILGRHAIEQDVEKWCNDGLESVSHIPGLWKVEVLGEEASNPDVGIITRSSVHDLKMHEQNAKFFEDVEFVMLIEPSRLVATAQVGLNSLIRHCRKNDKKLVFCTADKNCDGLVDALSHILMTSLEEVTATNKHSGVSSYMCWEADQEHLQHRMLPNLSRYLGVGTELSFVALKNQISSTEWYGGEAFPVQDMRWIAKQYYYELLRFASLPADQATFDEVFKTSGNMWNAAAKKNCYLTVEDENYNMYEAKRAFATRTTEMGFVNVISTDYLLKDYMAANDGIFDADSKAIPYIVADYAHTLRNVIYRLCLRLSYYPLMESDIRAEMSLLNIDLGDRPIGALWDHICQTVHGPNPEEDAPVGSRVLTLVKDRVTYTFDVSVITTEKRYNFQLGQMEYVFRIRNKKFIDVFLSDLQSAQYVAEDELETGRFLGTELRGHVFQKYLPGQFFTFGGKYYEMVRLALDGRVLVRRAADHINGRPQYRQVRNYCIENAVDSQQMGDCRQVDNIYVTKQYADIRVDTPAYWQMERYNDFKTAKRIAINGVPTRQYYNKQLLRIDFPAELVPDSKTLDTMAVLMNEVFRSLYAENQGMIVAVTPGQAQAPASYSLEGDGLQTGSLYIIEDSQMDIGFLVSVERNLSRIFSIMCDYLQWHTETLELSLNPPAPPEPESFALTDEERALEEAEEREKKRQKGIGGFFRKIGSFFKNLFKRKPKKGKEPEDAQIQDVPAQDYMMIYGRPHKKVKGKWVPCSQKEFDEKMAHRHQIIDDNKQAEQEAKERAKAAQEAQEAEGETTPADQAEQPAQEQEPDEKAKKKGGFFGKLFGGKKKAKEESAAEEAEPVAEEIPQEQPPVAEEPAAAEPQQETAGEPAQEQEPEKKAKKKGGFFSKLFGGKKKAKEEPEAVTPETVTPEAEAADAPSAEDVPEGAAAEAEPAEPAQPEQTAVEQEEGEVTVDA